MRVAVYGHNGMLGKHVVDALHAVGYIVCSETTHRVDAIINCAGVIPHRHPNDARYMITSNALLPHTLAAEFDGPIIHVSTDCVFSGRRSDLYGYKDTDTPDATDLYGRTKALGEVQAPNVCNVRTSFIGEDHGLMHWLMNLPQGSEIEGWVNARWSGTYVDLVAYRLIDMLLVTNLPNIVHLSTDEPMSKYWVLLHLVKVLGLDIQVKPVFEPIINRVLVPTGHLSTLPKLDYPSVLPSRVTA